MLSRRIFRLLTPICLVLALTSLAAFSFSRDAGAPPQLGATNSDEQRKPPPQEPRIRVEVALANVIVSVLDADGRPLPDLPKERFELLEEGVPQKTAVFETETQQPLDLALMIDSSASTFKELEFERVAAGRFIRRILRPEDRLSLFEFDEAVTQLTGFSANAERHVAALAGVVAGSGTSLYDAVALGSNALDQRPPGRRRVIVLVTDAGETTSVTKFEEARRTALAAEAMLYTILIRPVKTESGRNTAGEHALLNITDATGGAMYSPDTIEQLGEIFDRIERELRTQYRLAYYPEPRPPRNAFRRIEVRVKDLAPGAVIRHRRGYYTD
jgi:Ca-activated chloride channel family protein